MEENKISIGVALAPLVISVKEGKIGEAINLQLIEGLTPSGIVWRSAGVNGDIPVSDDNTVVFNSPGFYIPVILGHPQHKSYGITITE
jgi:hypothetical protein